MDNLIGGEQDKAALLICNGWLAALPQFASVVFGSMASADILRCSSSQSTRQKILHKGKQGAAASGLTALSTDPLPMASSSIMHFASNIVISCMSHFNDQGSFLLCG